MTREQFNTAMQALYDHDQFLDQITQFARRMFPHDHLSSPETKLSVAFLQTLKDLMQDEHDWIGYYIYELDWGTKTDLTVRIQGEEIPLKTFDDLYNLITQ
jgi:hypothetical protein